MTITNQASQSINKSWSDRWFAMLQTFGLSTERQAAPRTLRGSRITRLEVLPGEINAQVQQREQGVCTVRIQVATWPDLIWADLINLLNSQPLFVTQFLAGNVPLEIEQMLHQMGTTLLPASAGEIRQHCSCRASSDSPCPELVAVHQQFGEMLNTEPWLLLRLRGRDRQQIIQALQAQRSGNSAGLPSNSSTSLPTQAHGTESYVHRAGVDLSAIGDLPGLSSEADRFWGSRRQLEGFHHHIMAPSIELVLLRRLGPPAPSADGAQAYEALSALYRRVTAEALALAYASEGESIGERTNVGK